MTFANRVNSRAERAAQIVAAASTVWFVLAVAWGLFARIGGGHDAQIATRAIVAENMHVWHIFAPVKDYTYERPGPDLYYVHHPWGMFWVIAGFSQVLGRGTWVPRLAGVLLSVAIPPLLYSIGRKLWGPVPGAISALAYSVLPIALAFGNLPGFEVPINFSCLLATWGYLHFAERWNRRWMAVSLAGVLAATNSDWESVVFIGVVLVSLAAGGLALPRWFGRVRIRRFAEWWILSAVLSGASLVAYVVYFQHSGALENLLHSETQRARGDQMPLADVLKVRSYWIDVTFTPLVVTIGKIAVPIFVARVLFWRRIHEVFPLAILLMAVIEYVKFKNGADVHIYWPLPFAPYWALSLGMLTDTTIRVAQWGLAHLRRYEDRGLVPIVALAFFGLVALRVLPDGIGGLRYAKATAGRFNEKGRRIFDDVDTEQALEWMAARMAPNTIVAMAREIYGREYRGQEWALHRPVKGVVSGQYFAAPKEDRYFVGDLRFLNSEEQKHAATAFHVVTVGPYVFIDREASHAPIEAYSFDEREPNFLEWYFLSPTEPMRTVRADPWATWELREHYDQAPNPPPGGAPSTPEEFRIAHNLAVATGDAAAAGKWNAALLTVLDKSIATNFPEGVRLLGKRYVRGVDPTLELYFEANGPLPYDSMFEVVSNVESAPPLSLVPADDKVKQYGSPFVIAPRLWRKGFIYIERVDIRRRPGREYFSGYFDSQGAMTMAIPRSAHGYGAYLMTTE
jgi:4-amino-4-deoxy-L-arabinose transferase-like glycosyltransferase